MEARTNYAGIKHYRLADNPIALILDPHEESSSTYSPHHDQNPPANTCKGRKKGKRFFRN